jgi:glycosyltransferase involved in cell wall biosynthesis
VEAMGFGLPVVLTDGVGLHREVSAERAGIVTPASSAALTSALVTLLRDEQLSRELASNAAHLARTRYSAGAVIGQLQQIYSTISSASINGHAPVLNASGNAIQR